MLVQTSCTDAESFLQSFILLSVSPFLSLFDFQNKIQVEKWNVSRDLKISQLYYNSWYQITATPNIQTLNQSE